ncbi:MAG: hypothetical protein ABIU55_03785 [Ferruginibacter sp.]
MEEPQHYYRDKLSTHQDILKKLKSRKNLLSGLRLGAVILLAAILYMFWNLGVLYLVSFSVLIAFIFIRFLHRDIANRAAINHQETLIRLTQAEIGALQHQYYQFADGEKLKPSEHYYALDMDILGHASIYQYCNRTTSEVGAQTLANWLLAPAPEQVILQRQEAIKELSTQPSWNMELLAFGKENPLTNHTINRLQIWLQEPTAFLQYKAWAWLRFVLPGIMLSIIGLRIAGIVSMNVVYFSLFLFAVLAYQLNKIIAPIHNQLSRMVDEITTLAKSSTHIEGKEYQASLLNSLKNNFFYKGEKASSAIYALKTILDRLDIRYNIVISFPLNVVLLWNLQQVIDLEKWKVKHTNTVSAWFRALGEMEALVGFSTIAFNNPDWCFPSIENGHFNISATELGHPLINPGKRINNYINIPQDTSLMVVTGSNMAGKSTYLRSVGVNVVLAMAGSAVCATAFSLSPVQLLSSMRITDNLEESTSTFYAELKKLKTIIEKVNNHEKVFVLLDEILRGTNSSDRHKGSVALMKQMLKQHAAGIIATHDLALAELKDSFPENIYNYHFDVQVSNDELYFDYKLKPGVCQSLNASILMRKIGIEVSD